MSTECIKYKSSKSTFKKPSEDEVKDFKEEINTKYKFSIVQGLYIGIGQWFPTHGPRPTSGSRAGGTGP
jgi:hypothetical protein